MKVKKVNEAVDWAKAMEHNNDNIDRLARLRTQVNIDPVMEEVIDSTEKADENAKKVFTDLAKEAEDITPKDPDTGKKITMKPYTEKLSLDEGLFGESWITFDGSWKDQTVRKVFYEEDDISSIAEKLMNWYGECFEGWEAADIKDALYGLEGERIPGSSCPIVFTMEEDDKEELDWDNEEYGESLNTKLKEDNYDRPGYENMYLVSWEDSIGDYHESKVKADYPQHAIDKIKKSKHIYRVINVEEINMFTAPKRIRKAELIEKKKEKSKHLCEDFGVREYSDMLYDMIEDGEVDAKQIAEDLIYWCSEDDIKRYMEVNNFIIEDEEDEEVEESLTESVVANARHWLIDKENKSPEEATEIIKNSSPEELEKIALKWTKKESLTESEEKKSLVEVSEDEEDDEETVFDFVDERLFGDPSRRNASNYRLTNLFCKDVWVPLVGGKGRFRNVYFYPSGIEHLAGDYEDENRRAPMTDTGFAINLKSEDEASLAKAVADELNFKFSLTPINNSKYKFLAKIMIPESIYEMPIADYLESIGKSITDYRKRSRKKNKED